MSPEIDATVTSWASGPQDDLRRTDASAERLELQRLASEFEAMLLGRMLREMREAGRWDQDSEEDTFGALPLLEILDAELASHLARAQGLGVAREMLDAFDRSNPAGPAREAGAGPAVHADRRVTSPFGWRSDPFTGELRFHQGVDLRAAYGEEVTTAAPGRVVGAGPRGGYGTMVEVEHADGTRTRFAHLSVALVQPGDRVGAGQAIGRAGSSGRASGPHLHLERLDRDGQPINPLRAAAEK